MTTPFNRRTFLGTSTVAAGVALTSTNLSAKPSSKPKKRNNALETVRVAIMGVNGRGSALASGFARQEDVEVATICDVDQRALEKGVAAVTKHQKLEPSVTGDMRRILDDDSIDVLVVAAPNHWHAPATIMGCQAGKHVYVEKPCSHTPAEGEWAIQAARDNDRVVTMGSQRRSRQPIIDAIEKVHGGLIGDVHYARTWYNNRRGPIGTGNKADVPSWLNFRLWQGPVTDQPYQDNLVHYNWHWFWHYGNGELGNNGVHALDLARWGLQVDYPSKVTSAGRRYAFDDDQQTPDTHLVTFEFEKGMIAWEGLSWSPYGPDGSRFGVSFHGSEGSMVLFDSGYRHYDLQNKLVTEESGPGGDDEHFVDFLKCIREGGRPTADIEEGHKSTLLCHLGNIAQRTESTLKTNSNNGHIEANEEAAAMWTKEYHPDFEPKV